MPDYLAEFNRSYEDASTLLNDPKYAVYLQKWIDVLDLAGMARTFVNSLSGIVANNSGRGCICDFFPDGGGFT